MNEDQRKAIRTGYWKGLTEHQIAVFADVDLAEVDAYLDRHVHGVADAGRSWSYADVQFGRAGGLMDDCPVIGHDRCRDALEQELPAQPVLLFGPESTGKWALARWLGDVHAVWFNQAVFGQCGIDDVRDMSRVFLATGPRQVQPHLPGGLKVVQVNLDGAKSTAVQHALLKVLEEPPEYARFLLTASRPPLPTVSSRCLIWRLGRLSDEDVARVLVNSHGFSPKEAKMLAPIGGGRIAPALTAVPRFRPAKSAVLGVMRAIAVRDKDLLERTVRNWGETEDWMLRELLGSAASGTPSALFSVSERMSIGRTEARRGIAVMTAGGRARPQVAVRALAGALMEAK